MENLSELALEIIELTKETPNDQLLGAQIRLLVKEHNSLETPTKKA